MCWTMHSDVWHGGKYLCSVSACSCKLEALVERPRAWTMCSTEGTATSSPSAATGGSSAPSGTPTLLPYPLGALKQLNDAAAAGGSVAVAPNLLQPLDHYRLQLYNYAMAERLRFAHHYPGAAAGGMPLCPGYPPYNPRQLAFSMSLFHHRALQPEEPKPQHSYIGLIAMAILSSPECKLVLSDIYQYILDNYPYFRSRGPGWRNSIRHNLSLNDCFIKAGRSANGKGHYWAIHPANVEDFKKGDFRRRKAQRKVRKHMGLAVDEEGGDSPSPPPVPASPPPVPTVVPPVSALPGLCWTAPQSAPGHHTTSIFPNLHCSSITGSTARKRQFDVASLLAPDDEEDFGTRKASRRLHPALVGQSYLSSGEEDAVEEDIDVVTSDQDNNQGAAAVNKETETAAEEEERQGTVSGMLQPPPAMVWSPQHPHPLQVMFPGTSLVEHHQLVSRYYEQLAAVQQHQHRRMLQQQQQQTCSPTTTTENTDS